MSCRIYKTNIRHCMVSKLKIKKLTAFLIALIIALCSSACSLFQNDGEYELYNEASTTAVKSCVKIVVESRNAFSESVSIGSGVIYELKGDNYYVLTNNHVIEGSIISSYYIYDCYGNCYKAKVVKYSYTADLAVLSFTAKKGVELQVASFAEKECQVGDLVIAIGSPAGIFNTVTVGKVTEFKKVDVENETEDYVDFPVICHTALISGGSSGGVLLNKNFEIVGINFAGGIDDDSEEFVEGYAIPLDNIYSFLEE